MADYIGNHTLIIAIYHETNQSQNNMEIFAEISTICRWKMIAFSQG